MTKSPLESKRNVIWSLGKDAHVLVIYLLPWLIFFIAFYLQMKILPLGLDLHHDSFMFDAAKRALLGELPYKEFFYQYNLATISFHVAALKLFGVKIVSLKLATAYLYAAIAALIYACSVLYTRVWRAFSVALLWSCLSPFFMPDLQGYHAWSTVYMMAAVMTGLLFLLLALRNRPLLWSALGGVCFSLAFWFKQIAALQIIAIALVILFTLFRRVSVNEDFIKYRRIFIGYTIGGICASLPFVYYLISNSILYDWWQSAFVFNGLFASTGQSSTGMYAFLLTILPVSKQPGYISYLWALTPVFLIIYLVATKNEKHNTILTQKNKSAIGISFVAVLSIAGWIEYFPLAHSFHTQLFMSPVFVLIGVGAKQFIGKGESFRYYRYIYAAVLTLTLGSVLVETFYHLEGFREKMNRTYVSIPGDTPVSGLRLLPDEYYKFEPFYRKFLDLKEGAGDEPYVPLSVDPLRALLPLNDTNLSHFKMGVDWTWPNEIVEPTFNQRIAEKIEKRKAPIYADSIMRIQGYAPSAILQMSSPLTYTHALYKPTSDKLLSEPELKIVKNIGQVSSESFNTPERLAMSGTSQAHYLNYFPLDNWSAFPFQDIKDINVSVVRKRDIPYKLSKYEYEDFLEKVVSKNADKARDLYRVKVASDYVLQYPLSATDELELSKFFMNRGKLLNNQNLPIYFSTLIPTTNKQPFLFAFKNHDLPVEKKNADINARIVWSGFMFQESKKQDERLMNKDVYIAMPSGSLAAEEMALVYVQLVMNDETTREYYIFYEVN